MHFVINISKLWGYTEKKFFKKFKKLCKTGIAAIKTHERSQIYAHKYLHAGHSNLLLSFVFLLWYSLGCLVTGLGQCSAYSNMYTPSLPVALVCAPTPPTRERYMEREVGLGVSAICLLMYHFFSYIFVPILYFFLPFCAQLPWNVVKVVRFDSDTCWKLH